MSKQLSQDYLDFFVKSESGKYFVAELQRLIQSGHEKAENLPESARDFTQQVKGVREVLNHIDSVTMEVTKRSA